MTEHKLRKLVMNDGAKALAVKVIAEAKDYDPDAKANALQKQNEQEAPKAMM